MLRTMPRSWQAWKNWEFLSKKDSSVRFLTFVLSTLPELAGMEELGIFI
jgi:hypothetical protein